MMGRLQDKVAIITGADGGLCHKASEFFCKEGAKVVMVDHDANVESKCAEIVKAGGDAVAIVADVSKKEAWENILAATVKKYGRVDCVVNGAAEFYNLGDCANPEGFDEAKWDTVITTNTKSMLWSYHVVLQYMLKNEIKGNFINFSSAMAISWSGVGCEPYALSKAAIDICTKDMVKSFSGNGIRFNALAPQAVYVPKNDAMYQENAYAPWFRSIVPLGNWGQPEDAAWLMVYMASDEAKYLNGTVIPIDGGWSTCN